LTLNDLKGQYSTATETVYAVARLLERQLGFVTSRFTSTSSVFEIITVNALYKLLTYLLISSECKLGEGVEVLRKHVICNVICSSDDFL